MDGGFFVELTPSVCLEMVASKVEEEMGFPVHSAEKLLVAALCWLWNFLH